MLTDLTFWTQRCKHQDPHAQVCKAGVRYKDLVPEAFGRALRLPCCLTARSHDVVTCAKLERYTDAEAQAEHDEMERLCALDAQGTSPCCGLPVKEQTTERATVRFCPKCGKVTSRSYSVEEMP